MKKRTRDEMDERRAAILRVLGEGGPLKFVELAARLGVAKVYETPQRETPEARGVHSALSSLRTKGLVVESQGPGQRRLWGLSFLGRQALRELR